MFRYAGTYFMLDFIQTGDRDNLQLLYEQATDEIQRLRKQKGKLLLGGMGGF